MTPETADMIVWAAGISNLVALGTTIWNMVSSGARANAKTLDEHARRLEMIERQIELTAARLDRGPTHCAVLRQLRQLRWAHMAHPGLRYHIFSYRCLGGWSRL